MSENARERQEGITSMIQKKYEFTTQDDLVQVISQITGSKEYRSASGILLQLYNPRLDLPEEAVISYIRKNCPKGSLTGITCANIADEEFDISGHPAELNVTYFRSTRLVVMDFDMIQSTGFVGGRLVNHQLQQIPDAVCMLLCYSCSSAAIQAFLNEFSHHRLPIFGAKAGRSIRALNQAKVYSSIPRESGVVAVIFAGKDLRISMDNCLGFKEIGLEMLVTKTEGDNVIQEIDQKPAIEVYSKYLKVKPNAYFVQNVCEFPLVFHRRNCVISRVPSAYKENGAIAFTADVAKGERFRLSYGKPESLFFVVDRSAENLKEFRPEAVFLFECGNRVRFLKKQAECETNRFREIAPELSLAIGYAELFYSSTGDGGTLNSAIVAVGLTEEGSAQNRFQPCIKEEAEEEDERQEQEYIPFVERILHFLETTSTELAQRNQELGRIAYTDQLTRVYNRWELEHKIQERIRLAEEDHKPLSMIFMDIDHFKNVNDTYGHDVGDMVLKATVDLIKEKLQPQYIFGRWGGEEFVCALPDTEIGQAEQFAESLRQTIAENCYVTVQHVTMSFGVSEKMEGDTMDTLVKRADEALYQAKESGRNRVVTG